MNTTYALRRVRPPGTPEARSEAHVCPVSTCTVLCSPGHVACREHWRAVPQALRDPLIEAFRLRERDPVAFQLACAEARRLVVRWAGAA